MCKTVLFHTRTTPIVGYRLDKKPQELVAKGHGGCILLYTRRSAAVRSLMTTAPIKAGWYWLRRLGSLTPEIGFWTGDSFLLISPTQSVHPEDLERCCDGPMEPPEEYIT